MSESCSNTESCDGHDDSKGGEVDDVVIQFLKELEGSGDAKEVLLRYCRLYPAMAGEFRALAGARQVLVMSEPVDRRRVEAQRTGWATFGSSARSPGGEWERSTRRSRSRSSAAWR